MRTIILAKDDFTKSFPSNDLSSVDNVIKVLKKAGFKCKKDSKEDTYSLPRDTDIRELADFVSNLNGFEKRKSHWPNKYNRMSTSNILDFIGDIKGSNKFFVHVYMNFIGRIFIEIYEK